MIIKSMARKVPSFGQLIDYFHKEKFYRKAPTFAHNLWGSNEPDKIAEEFDHNATFLPKRANGNYMYHEVIVLGEYPDISNAKQERILLDLVQQYISLRAPDQMVYGRMHLDTNHLHFHLCISANTVRGHQRRWLSKARFAGIQREIEKYKLGKYPELGDEKYYDMEARKKKWKKAKQERESKAKISRQEFELKKRTGKPSQKEQDRAGLLEIFDTALSETEVTHRLAQLGFTTYTRGNTEGVVKTATGRKYRLKTLGLEPALQKTKQRLRIYGERRAELILNRAKARENTKDQKEPNDRNR